MIAAAGDAQSMMFQALSSAREGNFTQADSLMEDAEKLLLQAHRIQTSLIKQEAEGAKNEYSILIVHAQDHLMNGTLSKQLIKEMILLHKEIKGAK